MGTRLKGKTALITGAGSGMGRAGARLFAAEGARVVLADIDGKAISELAAELGQAAFAVHCDITDEDAVNSAVSEAAEQVGPISVLYNNAGIDLGGPGGDGATHLLPSATLNKTIDVNIKGMFHVSRAVIPQMLGIGHGSIINTASVAGALVGSAQHAYAATKSAVVGFTRSLAVGYAKNQIRANCICPGMIRTPLIDFILADDAQRERYTAGTPLGRIAEPEDVAPLALYLASDESSFVTGAVIPIDGGLTAQ
jgi:NAD(P)-dependent dehydrogenase (short-subunit alcohol dehydrogenase family)